MAFVSVDEYLADIVSRVDPLAAVDVPVSDAAGCVVAADVIARVDVPSFDNSAMDGYAVRRGDLSGIVHGVAAGDAGECSSRGVSSVQQCCADDTGSECAIVVKVCGDVPAGSVEDPEMGFGECVRIMTGAPVPRDADAIVPFEHTTLGLNVGDIPADAVTITRMPAPGAHIRRRGEDTRRGDTIIDAGTRLGARHLAAAVACGVDTVTVTPVPRVAVIATGAELVPVGTALTRGQIYDSNSTLIAELIAEAGAECAGIYRAGDTAESFLSAFAAATAAADAVITTGGVSVGAFDVVRLTLGDAAAEMTFTKVAMQPGKPQGFGATATGQPILALPGNPVSAFVSFEIFARPVIARLAGMPAEDVCSRRRRHYCVVDTGAGGWSTPLSRAQFMPVRYVHESSPGSRGDGDTSFLPRIAPATPRGSGSHLVGRLAAAQALAVIPADVEHVHDGDVVEVWSLTGT